MNCEYCGIDNTTTRIIKSKYGVLCRKHYLQMYKIRIITHSLNIINQHKKSKGIKKTFSGKYQAHITIDNKTIYLGTFDTYEEAKQKRADFEANLF